MDLRFLLLNEDACQSVRPPLKQHVSPLNKSFLDKFVATFGCFARLSTTSQEDASLFIFNGHEVSWYFNVNYIRPIRMRSEIVHEQVVSVVNKEVERVKHLFVVTHKRHL